MENEKEYGVIEYENDAYKVFVDFNELQTGYKNSEGYTACYRGITVLIVNNGTLRVTSDKVGINVSTGEGIIINDMVQHKLLLVSNEPCGFYRTVISPEFIFPEKHLMEKYGSIFIGDDNLKLTKLTDDNLRDETILDGINKIIAANLVKKSGYEIFTRGVLCNIWTLLEEYRRSDANQGRQSHFTVDEERVRAACKYISEHYSEMITLSDIADYVHLSDSECCRSFKRVIFASPIEYLMEYRIYSAARIILKNPGGMSSISDLSFMVGFNSLSYFNRIFKRYMQCAPTEYRKMTRNNTERAEQLFAAIQEEVTII